MALTVRLLTAAETRELNQLAHSRTAPHRLVQRTQMIWASVHGLRAPAIAQQVAISTLQVRAWLHRFNGQGMLGLADAPRPWRPRRHDEAARSRVIALARTKPLSLG
jgi:transposase